MTANGFKIFLASMLFALHGCATDTSTPGLRTADRYSGDILERVTRKFLQLHPKISEVHFDSQMVGPYTRRLFLKSPKDASVYFAIRYDERNPSGEYEIMASSGAQKDATPENHYDRAQPLHGMDKDLIWRPEFTVALSSKDGGPVLVSGQWGHFLLVRQEGRWKLSPGY
jgi:hypothetical protein